MAEGKEELKSLLMKLKEENIKFGLKLKFQKTKTMGSGPITLLVCNFLSSVSSQQKFEAMDGPVLQLSVIVHFYLGSKGKYILKAEGMPTQKT